MAEDKKPGGLQALMDGLPVDRLKEELSEAAKAMGEKGLQTVTDKITGATDSLNNIAEGGGVVGKAAKDGTKAAAEGDNPVAGALKGGLGGVKDKVKSALPGGGGGNKATKATNIIEEIDVGVPIDVAYNQWTQFQDFSGFMKKVDSVDQQEDTKVSFKAQVFWSHRTWEAQILEQVPNERIVWRSKGEKGHVDGAVTFHELSPSLTRILVVLEYYPQGLFERTGNLWRAQGRRARLELKHFRRHVMTRTILEDEEDVEGWRGEIRDGEVVRGHDEVVEEEQQEGDDYDEGEEPEDSYEDEDEEQGEYEEEPEEDEAEGEPEDEYEEAEDEPEDEYEEAEDEPEDEYEEEEEPEDEDAEPEEDEEAEFEEEPEDEYDEAEDVEEPEEEEEPEERPRRRSSGKKSSPRKRR